MFNVPDSAMHVSLSTNNLGAGSGDQYGDARWSEKKDPRHERFSCELMCLLVLVMLCLSVVCSLVVVFSPRQVVAILPPVDANEPVLHLEPASPFGDRGSQSDYINIKPMLAVPDTPAEGKQFDPDTESAAEVVSFGVTDRGGHDGRPYGSDDFPPARHGSRLWKAIRRRATSAPRAHVKDMDGKRRRLPRVLSMEEVPGDRVPSPVHRSQETTPGFSIFHGTPTPGNASEPETFTVSDSDFTGNPSPSWNDTTDLQSERPTDS
ncbi:uncharacterized protein [Dermacentor albipictus]|uniref:uncharacterized protein n=1 Tax=Dermacentor albipictus TaxID=60249 RepID=UPI0038FC3B75